MCLVAEYVSLLSRQPCSPLRTEPAWRERSVQFADKESRFLLGSQWYRSRWPIARGSGDVGIDGSGTYLHSAGNLQTNRMLHPWS